MGIGMLIGGVLAFVIAATKVVLPYDESFLGMTRDALPAINLACSTSWPTIG